MTGRMFKRIFKIGMLVCLSAGVSIAQPPQRPIAKPAPKVKSEPVEKVKPPLYPKHTNVERFERSTSEKAITVDPSVAIKLSVCEGAIKVNGSESNEVRVFVRNGRKFEFKALEKSPESGKPNWVWITSVTAPGSRSNCLAGDSVEIDMPLGGTVNLEARTAGAEIDSVKKAKVKIVEGSIGLRNVPNGVEAVALQGDVVVESSSGAIYVETTTGNILAFDVKPGQVGDLLKSRTNSGNISLQNVSHRQIEASSISGSLSFNGSFLAGGIYNFKTTNGSIRMLLPDDTSCRLVASYGYGDFNSSFPLQFETQNDREGGKSFVARIGKGETTTVSVTTSSGEIGIRKRSKGSDLKEVQNLR